MKALDALNITDGIAASQRGLVTSAQALAAGVGRMELSRLAANGHLERVGRGVYRASGAPSIREEAVWAAWLSLEPAALAHSRDPLAMRQIRLAQLSPEEDASFLVSLAPTAVGSNLAEDPDEHVVSGPYPYRYIAM